MRSAHHPHVSRDGGWVRLKIDEIDLYRTSDKQIRHLAVRSLVVRCLSRIDISFLYRVCLVI